MNAVLTPPCAHLTTPSATTAFRLAVDEHGIAWLTFDQPGSSANLLSESTLRELDDHLDTVELNPAIRALVFISAKERVFIAGADLKAIRTLPDWRVESLISLGQTIFCRIASLEIPTIAAIHGACVGGGMELALACDHRIASDADFTRLGLPETQLGLIPAWGGCTRLPRLIGLPAALDMILTGRLLKPAQALKTGLVDRIVPQEQLRSVVLTLAEHATPRPDPSTRITSRRPVSTFIAWQARRQLIARTHGHYEAPLRALHVIARNLHSSIDDGLNRERDTMLTLARGKQAAHLIDLFFKKEAAEKHPLPGPPPRTITSAAVIGSGVMGAGIAHWLASKGIRVTLCDISTTAVALGLDRIRHLLDDSVQRRHITRKQARDTMDRIHPAHEPVPLHDCPLVIEAATENLDLKKRIFADLAARTSPDAILATNTSALSVAALAATVPHPERVLGLHFFNPVHRMPLVEVIRLPHTDPVHLNTIYHFTQSIGKTPIVVRDSPGFIVNRILTPYLIAAIQLHQQGHSIHDIDTAMLRYGMPMGPLRLLDEIGLDVAQHVATTLSIESDALSPLIAQGHLGKKTGQGFYNHKTGKPALHATGTTSTPPPIDIQLHLANILTTEAKALFHQNIARSSDDIDLAMILGTGYPPFRGGPLATDKT